MHGAFNRNKLRASVAVPVLISMALLSAGAGQAQEVSDAEAASASQDDIIVTARKRSETSLDVPVSVAAFGKADLEKYGTRDFVGLSMQVPGLFIVQGATGAGGGVALRGISSSQTSPASDQAVSFNVDGVQLSSANIIRLAQIDVQQVEVLKGPQALFFGKNSPGGIISMRTADPGPNFELRSTIGYEANAREATGELVVSGPVTDTLGLRGVLYGARMRGYFKNDSIAVPGISYGPSRDHGPYKREIYARGTALYEPSDTFTLRAKYGYHRLKGSNSYNTAERIYCARGLPQVGGLPTAIDDCTANGHYYLGNPNPALISPFPELFPFDGQRSSQHLGSIEANYQVSPAITLTSVSGFYKIHDEYYGNVSYQPASLIVAGTDTHRRELSQELRLTTDFTESPLNFMIGGYFQDTKFNNSIPQVLDRLATGQATVSGTPGTPVVNEFFVDTTAYSFFGQAIWKITENLELAGGARWSKEKRKLDVIQNGAPLATANSRLSFNDVSPEVTITWKPSTSMAIFGAFRNGFKSGGFNTGGGPTANQDLSYRPEGVQGGEVGIKFSERGLRFNATAYRYSYKGLQVSTFDPVRVVQTLVNAASARVQGIEADISWTPPQIDGLNLHAALNYNHARYTKFFVGCYTGQTIAEGCNFNPNPATGNFRQQDFRGRKLTLAPDWSGNIGFSHETPISSGLILGWTGDANYTSGYWAQLEEAPAGYQKSYWTIAASVKVSDQDKRWQLALIGQNLTNVRRSRFVSQVPLTGISSRTGTNLEGGRSDLSAQIIRGQEVRLQLTFAL